MLTKGTFEIVIFNFYKESASFQTFFSVFIIHGKRDWHGVISVVQLYEMKHRTRY